MIQQLNERVAKARKECRVALNLSPIKGDFHNPAHHACRMALTGMAELDEALVLHHAHKVEEFVPRLIALLIYIWEESYQKPPEKMEDDQGVYHADPTPKKSESSGGKDPGHLAGVDLLLQLLFGPPNPTGRNRRPGKGGGNQGMPKL